MKTELEQAIKTEAKTYSELPPHNKTIVAAIISEADFTAGANFGATKALELASKAEGFQVLNVYLGQKIRAAIEPHYPLEGGQPLETKKFIDLRALTSANAKLELKERELSLSRATISIQNNTFDELKKHALKMAAELEESKKIIQKFITKSNGLSFYVRAPYLREQIERVSSELIEKIEPLYNFQCEAESLQAFDVADKGEG